MVGLFGNSLISHFLILFSWVNNAFINSGFVPPGTMQLKGLDFYVDKTEIDNFSWVEYLYDLERKYGKNSYEYKSALPDSAIWHSVYSGKMLSPFGEYAYYPVVGIYYEQAKSYCKWRSEKVNIKFTKYITEYKLPSKEQWEQIYSAFKQHQLKNSLYPYPKKPHHLVGLCDNVSEMTDTKGVAIGGNWKTAHSNTACNISIHYDAPQNYLGFRCIAYTIKKKK